MHASSIFHDIFQYEEGLNAQQQILLYINLNAFVISYYFILSKEILFMNSLRIFIFLFISFLRDSLPLQKCLTINYLQENSSLLVQLMHISLMKTAKYQTFFPLENEDLLLYSANERENLVINLHDLLFALYGFVFRVY